jgi:UDP-N-acetyl-D-galactosamine dehydrogenase
MNLNKITIGVVGLGYVGLPIALEFGKKVNTFGLDLNIDRVNSLMNFKDLNKEVDSRKIKNSKKLKFKSNISNLKKCNIFIVTVPTPLKKKTKPDLSLIIAATKSIAKILKPNDVVIYESTVYPGTTEDICVPILKKISKLNYINDKNIKDGFYCGYSPERINPGDKKSYLTNIPKVVSGSNVKITIFIKKLYELIIKKPIHVAPSIKIAEGAKIIENTQRDLNIALANEFLMIFEKLNIDYNEVFKAASTKWNFLKFTPGLVGGHCIGVDPYYLTYKAKKSGFNPKLILAGRKINDEMSFYYAKKCLNEIKKRKIKSSKIDILILGATFKENISDCRNSKVFDLIDYFEKYKCKINIFDPHILINEVESRFQSKFIKKPYKKKYDCVVLCVSHDYFKKQLFQKKINTFCKKNFLLFDMKYFLDKKYFNDKYFTI